MIFLSNCIIQRILRLPKITWCSSTPECYHLSNLRTSSLFRHRRRIKLPCISRSNQSRSNRIGWLSKSKQGESLRHRISHKSQTNTNSRTRSNIQRRPLIYGQACLTLSKLLASQLIAKFCLAIRTKSKILSNLFQLTWKSTMLTRTSTPCFGGQSSKTTKCLRLRWWIRKDLKACSHFCLSMMISYQSNSVN